MTATTGKHFDMLVEKLLRGPGRFQRGQRIEDDPAGLTADKCDIC